MSSADLLTFRAWARAPASDRSGRERIGNDRAAGDCAAFRRVTSDCPAPTATSRTAIRQCRIVAGRLVALLLLLSTAPLIALLMAAVRLTSKGPALYQQRRVGQGGRVFTMWKLRTMRSDAEQGTGPVWAPLGCDPRVTPLGYWLRRLHLDELPQLVNVLRGEMAIVGPRPERPEFVTILATQIPGYLDRLEVLPGITGLAQINLPPDTDLDSVRRKLVLDQQYIREASAQLELRIVLCTALRLVGLRGGRAVRLLGLQRNVELPSMPSILPHAAIERPTLTAAPPEMAAIER
jgi:lipopolysaccharide/colanic/teichoic acid biosynthesis glycosyltransferase